eukprot:Amastigsp_a843223_14.p3 type:complete len:118 gc:universal Amastigsp_a843223_14:747-394(-)
MTTAPPLRAVRMASTVTSSGTSSCITTVFAWRIAAAWLATSAVVMARLALAPMTMALAPSAVTLISAIPVAEPAVRATIESSTPRVTKLRLVSRPKASSPTRPTIATRPPSSAICTA